MCRNPLPDGCAAGALAGHPGPAGQPWERPSPGREAGESWGDRAASEPLGEEVFPSPQAKREHPSREVLLVRR